MEEGRNLNDMLLLLHGVGCIIIGAFLGGLMFEILLLIIERIKKWR